MTKDEALKLALECAERCESLDGMYSWSDTITAIKEALAQPEQPPLPVQEPMKLWLWKNFVDGKPEYWAFDNPFPIFMDSRDPQTLGEPCGYAWFKPSRVGRTDVNDEQVLRGVQKALAQPERQWIGLTEEEHIQVAMNAGCMSADWLSYGAAVEQALKEKNTFMRVKNNR